MRKILLTILTTIGLLANSEEHYKNCAGCHGENGEGMAYVAPNIKSYDDSLVASVLKDGKKSSIGTMPSFEGRLSDTQVKAVAAYLRGLGE